MENCGFMIMDALLNGHFSLLSEMESCGFMVCYFLRGRRTLPGLIVFLIIMWRRLCFGYRKTM